jgi:hypothetical protein
MKTTSALLLLISIFTSANVFAASKELHIQGDLMIHPNQISQFFTIATQQIGSSTSWSWPQLNFTKPYKTQWSQVAAQGPFAVTFQTSNLATQEVGFTLGWAEPVINVGRFEIHDTIQRRINGVDVVLNLDGACNNMVIRVPAANWKVAGTMKYIWTAQGMQTSWKDFQFTMAGTGATVDIGQCEGPSALQPELREAILSLTSDQQAMSDIIRDGVLDWVQSSLGGLQTELMKPRAVTIRDGLTMTWQPAQIQQGDKGLMRVAGEMVFNKDGVAASKETVPRSYSESDLSSVKESGFLFPKDALVKIVAFIQSTGDLGYRLNSSTISSFQSLMQNSFLQFFIWPDLLSFNSDTQFYFDISTSKTPSMSNARMLDGGGISYDFESSLLVRQWAPAKGAYVPYMNFSSPLSGTLAAKVADGSLTLQMNANNNLWITNQAAPEYLKIRPVNEWIATSLLGSRIIEALQDPFKLTLPDWQLGQGMSLGIRDVQTWRQSFRIPLEFKVK